MRPENLGPSDDPLALATAALRDAGNGDAPSEAIAAAERIPTLHEPSRISRRLILSAASATILLLGALAIFLFTRSSEIVFADVVRNIDNTHTFTATIDAGLPSEQHIMVEDSKIRLESKDLIQIIDVSSATAVYLDPSTHVAGTEQFPAQNFDLYTMLHGYHTGSETPVGEKIINGKKLQGFRIARAAPPTPYLYPADMNMTFWVDPQTNLPIQIDVTSADGQYFLFEISDLHFDVALADSLFSQTVPGGYVVQAPPALSDWDRLRFAGQVVDERGKPIQGVKVEVLYSLGLEGLSGGFGGIGPDVTTDRNGQFSIDAQSHFLTTQDLAGCQVRIEFRHPDYVFAAIIGTQVFSPEQRANLRVRLRDGVKLSGTVVDPDGNPVAGAMVQAVYGELYQYRRATVTDSAGKFALHALAPDSAHVQVLRKTGSPLLSGHAAADLSKPVGPLSILVSPVMLPAGKTVHKLLGMTLVNADADLQAKLFLADPKGVVVLDGGANSQRLGIGELTAGDRIWMIGNDRINNFQEMVQHLLAECGKQAAAGRTSFIVRSVYDFCNPDEEGAYTGSLNLSEADLADIKQAALPDHPPG